MTSKKGSTEYCYSDSWMISYRPVRKIGIGGDKESLFLAGPKLLRNFLEKGPTS